MANHPLINATSARSPGDRGLPPRRNEVSDPQKAELQSISGFLPKLLYERYGILENPFGVTPNPRYLYQSKTHAEARSSLIIGIECGVGFHTLIAPPGMGKTTILFNIGERFDKVARIAFLSQLHGDSRDFLRYLVAELGDEAHDSNPVGMQDTINRLLVREYRAGRQTIIVIDEAQNLTTSVLETVRQLSNFETPSEKLVQIILAGQPQLAQRLASPEMTQLQQRIPMLTTLLPFGLEDTRNYIEHRLIIAGYKGPPLFTSAALRVIWENSGGVPREINRLCFNALLLARAGEQTQVNSDILHEVVADLDLDRIRLNTGTPPGGMRGVQTTSGLSLGNTAEDSPATSIDGPCKAAVSDGNAEADDIVGRVLPESDNRFDHELVGWFAQHGGVWSGTAAELRAAIKTGVDVSNDWWPLSPRELYAHIESHRQILWSWGIDVSLYHGFPGMVSLRSCQDEKPARNRASGTSGIKHTFDSPTTLRLHADGQKTSPADSGEVSPVVSETFSQDIPNAETSLRKSAIPESTALGSLASKLTTASTLLWLAFNKACMRCARVIGIRSSGPL
jgi:general secretion pathway protein A